MLLCGFPFSWKRHWEERVGRQEASSSPGFTEAGVTNAGKYILISSRIEDHVTSSVKLGAGWVGGGMLGVGGTEEGAVSPCHPSKGWRK